MKKLLGFFLVASILCCCFGITGCENDGIEYTAEKPIFQYQIETLENYEELQKAGEMYWTINGCDPIKNFKFYTDFSKYYAENLKEDGTYLLYRSNEIPPLTPYDMGSFNLYREKETGDLILNESFDYYDTELGTKPYKDEIPYNPVSLFLDVYIKAIGKVEKSGLMFEFGKLEEKYYGHYKYINIYTGDKCFATCYYNNDVTIPRAWFENYFKTNLIYGDEL